MKTEASEHRMKNKDEFVPQTGPIVGAMSVISGWLIFILAFALYWSKGFDLFQNVIVTIVSISVACLLIGGIMLVWYRLNGELRRKSKPEEKPTSLSS